MIANDIDPWCSAAVTLNASLNCEALGEGELRLCEQDLLTPGTASSNTGGDGEQRRLAALADAEAAEVILAGDVCYEQPLAGNLQKWLLQQLQRKDTAGAGLARHTGASAQLTVRAAICNYNLSIAHSVGYYQPDLVLNGDGLITCSLAPPPPSASAPANRAASWWAILGGSNSLKSFSHRHPRHQPQRSWQQQPRRQ